MKTMSIYEPAMCCETGLCGVGVDPELLRISTVINHLKKNAIIVKRYNLSSYPQEFVQNEEINKLINDDGIESLPATVVDGKIVKTKAYPSNGGPEKLVDLLINSGKRKMFLWLGAAVFGRAIGDLKAGHEQDHIRFKSNQRSRNK